MSRQINKGDIVKIIDNTSGHNFRIGTMAECTDPIFNRENVAEFIGLDLDGGVGTYYMNDQDFKKQKKRT